MKDKLVHVTDPVTLDVIRLNGFDSPIHVSDSPDGVWVLDWSLEQYRERHKEDQSP